MNVFITGVSSGLGRSLVDAHLGAGHRVFGCSRREVALDGLQFVAVDVNDFEQVQREIPRLLEGVDSLDLVILNAGVLGKLDDLRQLSLDDLKSTLDTNLWSNKTLVDTLFGLSVPIQQIVAISSGAAVNGNRGWAGYSISKAALNMLMKLYASENPETHFASIAPGIFESEIQDEIAARPDDQRFVSMGNLKAKNLAGELPHSKETAEQLVDLFPRLPQLLPSGEFGDIRKPPLCP